MSFLRRRQVSGTTPAGPPVSRTIRRRHLPPADAPAEPLALKGHTHWVRRVVVLPDGAHFATACRDGHVRVFALDGDGNPVADIPAHESWVPGLAALGGDVLVSGGDSEAAVATWSASTGDKLHAVDLRDEGVTAIAALGRGRFAVATRRREDDGADVVLLSHTDGVALREESRVEAAHGLWVSDLAFHGDTLCTASDDKTAGVWSVLTGERLAILRGHTKYLNSIDASEQWIATGSDDKSVRVYRNGGDYALVAAISGLHKGYILSVSILSNSTLMTGSTDETLCFTPLSGDAAPVARVQCGVSVRAATVLPDARIAVGGGAKTVFQPPAAVAEQVRMHAAALLSTTSALSSPPRNVPPLRLVPMQAIRPSGPIEKLVEEVEEASMPTGKRTRTESNVDDLEEVPVAKGDVCKKWRCDNEASCAKDLEEADEKVLIYLDKEVNLWIRHLQSRSSDISESDKLATIARIEETWKGWAVSPENVSYELDSNQLPVELGKGAFATVLRATLCRGSETVDVAIKRFSCDIRDSASEAVDRIKFMREVLLMKRASHPNVVEFKGAFWPKPSDGGTSDIGPPSSNDQPFIATELMKTNLRKFKKLGFLPGSDSQLFVLLSVAKALEYLHGERIVHQDVSPDNVLLQVDESCEEILAVKLGDFGVSRVIRRTLSRSGYHQAGAGKLQYMAPEGVLTESETPLDFSVDVWSFGVLCTFVILNRTALEGVTEFGIWKRASEGKLSGECVELARDIPDLALRDVCVECLQEDPSKRPSMKQVRNKIEALTIEQARGAGH